MIVFSGGSYASNVMSTEYAYDCTTNVWDLVFSLPNFPPRASHGLVTLADAQLIVSELVTNSVVHADAPAHAQIRVLAESGEGVLWLAVGDAGVDGAISMRTPELGRSGLGLHLLDELAQSWGIQRSSGTLVWFELADGV